MKHMRVNNSVWQTFRNLSLKRLKSLFLEVLRREVLTVGLSKLYLFKIIENGRIYL